MPDQGLLIVSSNFHPDIGGAPSALLGLSTRLVRSGIPVTVWTPRQEPSWPKREEIEGITVQRFPRPTSTRLGPFRFDAAIARGLLKHTPKFRWVLLNSVTNHTATALMLARARGKPTLLRMQNTGERGDFTRASGIRGGWLTTRICAGADRFVASSTVIRDELIHRGISANRIQMIPNGVDHLRFSPGTTPTSVTPQRVIYLGRLVEQKQVELLLRSWRLVMDQLSPDSAILDIHGEGPLQSPLEEMAGKLELQASVKFCGVTTNAAAVLSSASAFVLCSRVEGMSNSLLEAMASGLAVVSTSVSGATDLIDHEKNGLLVSESGPEPLAKALVQLIRDRHLASQLGRAARQTIETGFTLDHAAERYGELLKSLG